MDDGKRPSETVIYRNPLPVRIFHWMNALAFILLLLSGFQIFNAHPRLYIGQTGYYDTHAVLEITGRPTPEAPSSWIRIGDTRIPTTGFLGDAVDLGPPFGIRNLAFPSWLRLPSGDNLAAGRGWHFLMAWVLVINGSCYLAYSVFSGRIRRELLPTRAQWRVRAIAEDIWMHVRLRHSRGEKARHYNFLQKIAYLVVIFGLFPAIVATGMTMSNSALARFPSLIDIFQGRQTARTIHFICAISLLAFLAIHLFQVVAAGFLREMRAMITGYYHLPPEKTV